MQLVRGYVQHLISPSPAQGRADPLDRGLIGDWRFDPPSGAQLTDFSGFGHPGTLIADTSWATGRWGPALDFDGTGDYVDVGSHSTLQTPGRGSITVEVLFNTRALVANQSVVELLGEGETEADNALFLWWQQADGDIRYIHEYGAGTNADHTFNLNLSASVWYHVIMSRDVPAQTVSFYVDGTFVEVWDYGAAAHGDPTGGTAATFYIGRNLILGATENFDGQISLVRYYGRKMTSGEIRARYLQIRQDNTLANIWTMPRGSISARQPRHGFTMYQIPGIV